MCMTRTESEENMFKEFESGSDNEATDVDKLNKFVDDDLDDLVTQILNSISVM